MLTQTTRQRTCCGILRKDAEGRSEHELTLLVAVMREVPQFQQLDGASLKAICRSMELKRFAKGDVIVQEGDPGSEFYVLIRGAVSIYNRPEEASGQEQRPRVPRDRVDYTVAPGTASGFKMPEVKAKSRAHALNRRISYTVDWDAELEGEIDEVTEEFSRRVSAIEEARRSSFTDSESEDAEDVTQMLRNANVRVQPRMTRRLSSDKEQLEEKSPRRAGLRAAALLPGSSFGEFSLLSTQLPRQSTAKCEEKSSVAILRRDDYRQILEKTPSRRRSEWLAFAQAAPILRNLEQSTRLLLEPLVKIQQVTRGQKVVKVGDPVQVLFLAEGICEVASSVSGEADSSEAVTSALMAPPSCFGLSAHCRNDMHFEESLTSCSAGKLYVLQTKHLWMMLSSHQQDALTRAASYERWFHLARATVMRAFNQRPTRQLYAASSRLGILQHQLQTPQECSEEGQGVERMLARSWSKESLQAVAEVNSSSLREKLPRLEPDLSRVRATEVPKTRLHSSLLPLWSPNVLLQRQSLHRGQEQGVFHGYGPAVQANRFVTRFFKVHSGPWSHACQSSASHSSRPAQLQPAAAGDEEEFFEAFEDDGSMSPLLDAKIKETVRQRRLQEEWRTRAEKAAATLQGIVRRFLRHRRKQNHAATCIQRAFRSRQTLETSSIADTPLATPSPTPEVNSPKSSGSSIRRCFPAEHHGRNEDLTEGKHTVPGPGSILQLDLEAPVAPMAPKLQELKKALARRGNHRSWRSSRPFQEVADSADSVESSLCLVKLPKAEVPPLFVPLDLIEKHRLLMETQVLDDWPNADRLPALKRLRRNWEKLQRKPPSTASEVVVAPPTDADLGAWKLPVLPSRKGTLVFSARLSAAHPDHVSVRMSDWNREREMEEEIDPTEIYRPRPSPPRFRSMLRRC